MPTTKPATGRKGRGKIRPMVLVAGICLATPALGAAFLVAEERHNCSTKVGNFEYARCIGAACKRRLANIGREIVPAVLGGSERLDLTVSSAAELKRALDRAGPGSVIRLAPGTYPALIIRSFQSEGTITITSANPARRAVVEAVDLRDSTGIEFKNLDFAAKTGSTAVVPFLFMRFARLTLDGVTVHGPDNEAGYLIPATMFRDGTALTIRNSRFHRLKHAVQMLTVTGARIEANEFWDLRTDAIRGGGVSDVTIERNVCTEFHPAVGDHPDCIQLWSTNQESSARDITIRDNLVFRGKTGAVTQGIFIRDTHDQLPFYNVKITGNLMVGTMYNGIAIDGVVGATIDGNEVVAWPDQLSWIRVRNGTKVEMRSNRAAKFLIQQSTVEQTGNQEHPAVSDRGSAAIRTWLAAVPTRRRPDSLLIPLIQAETDGARAGL
jgi:hypothetical protein